MSENQTSVNPRLVEQIVTPAPFYQDEAVTIYCGDTRLILPFLGRFDLLLTDPPYGIKESSDKVKSRQRQQNGNSRALADQRDYGEFAWDKEPVDEWVMMLARQICDKQIIFGGNYYTLPPTKCWLVWDKQNGDNDFADCELAWTNMDKAVRRKVHLWNGMIRKGQEARFHPTQKPLEVISWALGQAGDVQTVLDPWMGSGTTLRAAKDAGKKAVGIEQDEKYCKIAVERLKQEVLL